MTCAPPASEPSLYDWWAVARTNTTAAMRKGLASLALLIPWKIWKHRNDCIFNNARPSVADVINRIKDEATLWVRAGATGHRVVLPITWDVH
jgi:nuclear pore complex protein Nup210